jgi:hypothetical protein
MLVLGLALTLAPELLKPTQAFQFVRPPTQSVQMVLSRTCVICFPPRSNVTTTSPKLDPNGTLPW